MDMVVRERFVCLTMMAVVAVVVTTLLAVATLPAVATNDPREKGREMLSVREAVAMI